MPELGRAGEGEAKHLRNNPRYPLQPAEFAFPTAQVAGEGEASRDAIGPAGSGIDPPSRGGC